MLDGGRWLGTLPKILADVSRLRCLKTPCLGHLNSSTGSSTLGIARLEVYTYLVISHDKALLFFV